MIPLALAALTEATLAAEPAPPEACVIRVVHEECGTFLGNPSPAWKVVSRSRVALDAAGTCVSETRRSAGVVSQADWRREPGAIVGTLRSPGFEVTITVAVDETDRPMSSRETYTRPDGPSDYVHRWRVERDGFGKITRLETSQSVVAEPEWPAWGRGAYNYTRAGASGPNDRQRREFVQIANAYEEINLVLERRDIDFATLDSVTLFNRDWWAVDAACFGGDPDPMACLERAESDESPLRDGPIKVATGRVIGWDRFFGLPRRMAWLPGFLQVGMDVSALSGEERFSYDRLDRLVRDELRPFNGNSGARTAYGYSPGCEDVPRDWSREATACPRQLDLDFWTGWPAL